jgi:hypothetical protein
MSTLRDYPVMVDELDESVVTIAVDPAHAPCVTLFVVPGTRRWRHRTPKWVVARDQDGHTIISEHAQREVAVRAAILRARRYARAYCVPRGLAGVS